MTAVAESPSQTDQIDFMKSRAARKQHDQIVDWSKKQFWRMKEDRNFIERQWYINLAFMYGKQYVAFRRSSSVANSNTSLLWVPPAPSWRVRAVINKIRPTVRTEIAQLTNNKPNATVVPASAEERDMYAAMAAEQVWESLSTTKEFSAIIEDAIWWNQVCGNGYMKQWWDFNAGEKTIPGTDKKMGEICFASETPFHVFVPDLLEKNIENQPYLIHAQMKPKDWVTLRYSEALKGKDVKTQETTGREIFESAFLNLVGASSTQKQHMVLLLECYIKPGMSAMFPEGGMYTVLGDTIIQNFVGMPYAHKQYPFSKLDHIPSGKYYSTSSIEDLVPLQKEYNRKFSQIVENANRMSKLQIMCEEGAVDPRKMTTEPGQVIFYKPGYGKPEAAPSPALPAYVPQIMDRLLNDYNDISGQHEITHGQVPPGVTAATAISFLQERDETKLSPTFASLERAIEKTARQALVLVHDYWTVEETIKITGPEGSFDSMTFKGSDLANNLDIRIEAGSALPTSKAARQAFILDMMKLGFIKPEDGLEVLDMGGLAKIYERIQVDRRQAQRENLRMSKATPEFLEAYDQQNQQMMAENPNHFGEDPVIDEVTGMPSVDPMTGMPVTQPKQPPLIVSTNTWDNHQAHILHHNNYRKSQAFEMLPEETRQIFEAHVQEHIAALGIESITMQPRASAGLPPTDPYAMAEQQQEGGSGGQPPGPMPMPEGMTE
jgi:hypothetical protein